MDKEKKSKSKTTKPKTKKMPELRVSDGFIEEVKEVESEPEHLPNRPTPSNEKKLTDKDLAKMTRDAKSSENPKEAMKPVIQAHQEYLKDSNCPNKNWAIQHYEHLISRYSN